MKRYLFLPLFLFALSVHGQDTTKVILNLNDLENETVSVQVYPPTAKTTWEYVIPEIIPGTYMKVNYVKFYNKVEAFDTDGNQAKVSRKKNVFKVSGDQPISYITYMVNQTLGTRKVWDNILPCGGSAYNRESALINFQVVNGYFEGYEDQVFQIQVDKPKEFYGASSIEKSSPNPETDLLFADNYDALIDQPILYAKPDTVSFKVEENTFKIAVYAESGKKTAKLLEPRFQTLMQEINDYSGFTTDRDYTFLFYYIDSEKQKGLLKDFGKGSALEHKYSSVYYDDDVIYDSTFSIYNWIGSHEYYHTLTPLSLHSEKIAEFNFRTADMSRHVWMYEGVTDYLAMLFNAQSQVLNSNTSNDLASATQYALDRSKQSMTDSGRNIIRKRNVISFIKKVKDIGNFYEKGKLIAFAMDMELMERSEGKRRLLDVMVEMDEDYRGNNFKDAELLSILEKYMYPGFEAQFKPYIEGSALPPYEAYFSKMGWTFYPKKTKLPSYGRFYWSKDRKNDRYYVAYENGNELSLERGDTVLTVNQVPVHDFINTPRAYYENIFFPKAGDHLALQVKREGKVLDLEAEPKLMKLKGPRMKVEGDRSDAQKAFSKKFFMQE